MLLFFITLVIFASLISLAVKEYIYFTHEVPQRGGTYVEGVTGQPKTINPLFAPSNLPDRDLSYLIYSGLTKIDENGNVVPDIAESWETLEGGKKVVFKLRKNLKWQDGEDLLSNDIQYTFSVIQDPDYAGPLKNQWKDIEIEIPDEYTVVFNLKSPQPVFIYNTTLGILPEHIWAGFAISDMPYVEQNFKPVGSGKFKFKENKTDESNFIKSITLERNEKYYSEKPNLDTVIFKFYKSKNDVFDALTKKDILGTCEIISDNYSKLKEWKRLKTFSYVLPGYKAIFINSLKNPALASLEFKSALDLSIDKENLVENSLNGTAELNNGFVVRADEVSSFNLEKAKEIVKGLGMIDTNNDGFLEKDNKKIELKLDIVDDKESETVAMAIKKDWAKLGVDLKIEKKSIAELERDIIRPRNYELLFFGQNPGINLDLYSFWHSSEQRDPGLNFTNFSSKRVDILLENTSNEADKQKRNEVNAKVEEIIKQERAAIFLYSPVFNFTTDKKIKGRKKHFLAYPEHRFIDIERWYLKSKRVF